LVANAIGRGTPKLPHGQLIMVASAMPGEGKTFTSLNLAFSMSLEKDAHVLLVDADVAKPHVSRLLGLAEEPGLLDALADPVLDAEALVMGTDVPNLAVLPAGHREEHATELLASARMEEIMRRIAEADPARIVVFDSPPLLLTTESRALAEAAGQVVLVVRADTTPQHVVLDALSYLPEGKNIFLLLNQSVQGGRSGYYYGYGYASGSASGSTAEGQTRPE
jgi:exopolysaccharide/PEP-CTERM locus tyrosine autokinase